MRIQHSISVPEDIDNGIRDLLAGVGAQPSEHTGNWRVPDHSLDSAIGILERRKIDFRLLYNIPKGEGFETETAAAYLCLKSESEANPTDNVPIILEPMEGLSVLANSELIALISAVTPDLIWGPERKDGLRELEHAPLLPDPVELADVFSKDQGKTGIWLIGHDGQEFLTDRNIEIIRTSGAAWSDKYRFESETFPVLSTLIFRGKVIDLMLQHGVEFAAPPIYLRKQPKTDDH
ncbi:hypothetical protein AB0C96_10530 [Streptomyces sp. NPDC048506]|uniref:hypothetical protein n=1 Tax=Streptomyces sp. NPDC048506 TaxID=3155028 RepID=UPI003427A244